jgi:hypothetical protein
MCRRRGVSERGELTNWSARSVCCPEAAAAPEFPLSSLRRARCWLPERERERRRSRLAARSPALRHLQHLLVAPALSLRSDSPVPPQRAVRCVCDCCCCCAQPADGRTRAIFTLRSSRRLLIQCAGLSTNFCDSLCYGKVLCRAARKFSGPNPIVVTGGLLTWIERDQSKPSRGPHICASAAWMLSL